MHASCDRPKILDRKIRLTPRRLSPRALEALRALGYRLEETNRVDRATLEEVQIWFVDIGRLSDFPNLETAPDMRVPLIAPPGTERGKCSTRVRRSTCNSLCRIVG